MVMRRTNSLCASEPTQCLHTDDAGHSLLLIRDQLDLHGIPPAEGIKGISTPQSIAKPNSASDSPLTAQSFIGKVLEADCNFE